MANVKYSYEELLKIANMSVDEYKDKYGNDGGFFGTGTLSDDDIKNFINGIKHETGDAAKAQDKWNTILNEADKAYDEMYANSLKYLEITANISDAEKDEAYNASVSDNYATGMTLGSQGEGTHETLKNITIDGYLGPDIDLSETQLMKKTLLSDGKFVTSDNSGKFDDFTGEAIGETRKVAGGTITNLGVAEFGFGETIPTNNWASDIIPINDEQKGHMVHYEGYLGSFDYNTRDFEIAYYQTTVNGNTVSVPTLHYIGDKRSDRLGVIGEGLFGKSSDLTDGSKIKIPEGLKVGDYMFTGTNIESIPELPEGLTSAHGMFMNCKHLTTGCAKAMYDSTSPYAGSLKMPSSLQDASWMFAGCDELQTTFGSLGRNLVDGRFAFSGCVSLGWDGKTIKDGKMVTSFKMPGVNELRYANPFWLANMYDGCDDAVVKKITKYINEHGGLTSQWTDSDGVHHNRYDSLIDGSYDKQLQQDITNDTARGKILQLVDPESKGLSGASSDTLGLASYGTQLTDSGTFADNSVWAKFRQSDFKAAFGANNQFGEIIDRAIPAIGTYAISKRILKSILGDGAIGKSISTVGAVAIATVPQIVGVGNRLTPMLDWTAKVIGSDTKVGKFFTDLSNKLKGSVAYNTKVEELNPDKTFEATQESAVKYAENQVSRLMTPETYDGKETIIPTMFDVSADMKTNGELLAKDANLLFIACEPEENLKNTLSDSIMKTSVEALRDKMDLDLKAAGTDKAKISEVRDKYSNYYIAMMYNLDAYDNAARAGIDSVYAIDTELKSQAMNGLEKVMRCTARPVYNQMTELQDYWKKTYGEDFFTDKQLNDSKMSLNNFDMTGIGKFSDYDPSKDYSDHSDVYVDKLKIYQEALTLAISETTSQDEINAAYANYYESAYGWAFDEAKAHGVILDQRDTQTTAAEKNRWDEFVKRAKEDKQASPSKSESSAEASSADKQADTTVQKTANGYVYHDVSSASSLSQKRYNQAVADLGLQDIKARDNEMSTPDTMPALTGS